MSARLYNEDSYDRMSIGAWCADVQGPNQYLQVDLGSVRKVTFIATQGTSHRLHIFKQPHFRVKPRVAIKVPKISQISHEVAKYFRN